jgi:hypothetical protein
MHHLVTGYSIKLFEVRCVKKVLSGAGGRLTARGVDGWPSGD